MNLTLRNSRAAGILISIAAYVAAFAGAVAAVNIIMPHHPLLVIALGDFTATVIIFFISVLLNNSSMYDPYWSVKPAVIAWYYFCLVAGDPGTREILVVIAVTLYAIRLTSNFYRDWPGLSKEDFRYVNFRRKFPRAYWPVSFLAVHFFPTVMVYMACLPMYGIYQSTDVPLNGFDFAGFTVIICAVILAFVADEQLRRFKEEKENEGKTIGSGLWRISRHPNYLGEILTWWGLYLLGLGAGLQWWWTGIGAVAITVMFVFASIPLMEERMMMTRADYPQYKSRTPMLIPFIK